MVVQDILNLLPEDDEDYPLLSKSLQALRQIQLNATQVCSCVCVTISLSADFMYCSLCQRAKQRKNIDKVIEIQNRLSDSTQLALPHRRYVFEVRLKSRYSHLLMNLKRGRSCLSNQTGKPSRTDYVFSSMICSFAARERERKDR